MTTMEWLKLDDVSDEKCEAQTVEELVSNDNLLKFFEYRCNLRL